MYPRPLEYAARDKPVRKCPKRGGRFPLSRLLGRAGVGVPAQWDSPLEERTLTRAFGATSLASGRGQETSGMRENVLFRPALQIEQSAGRQEIETGFCQLGAALPDQHGIEPLA